MSDDPQSSLAPPEVRSSSETAPETQIATARETPGAPLTVFDAATPLPVQPEMLTEGLRLLQERIPGYVHLSVDEQRSMLRAAHLDPEFIDGGIRAATVWGETKEILGWSGEESRQENDVIAGWDEAIKEFRIVLQGMEDANLQRKHRLGSKILQFYSILKITIDMPSRRHLRPYLEEMKRAYMRNRKKPSKREPKGEPEEPKE